MRKLLISSLGVVGMLVISAFAFASSQNNIPADNSEKTGTVPYKERELEQPSCRISKQFFHLIFI